MFPPKFKKTVDLEEEVDRLERKVEKLRYERNEWKRKARKWKKQAKAVEQNGDSVIGNQRVETWEGSEYVPEPEPLRRY